MKTLITRNIAAVAGFLFSTVLMVSCSKDALVAPVTADNTNIEASVPAETNSSSNDSTGNTENTAGITTLINNANLSQNFSAYTTTALYTYTNAMKDFKNVVFWEGQERTKVSGGALVTVITKNNLGGAGGVISRVDVPDASEYQLSYRMKFHTNFDFSWGGKVGFGFLLGDGFTGGGNAQSGTGGSARIMWYKNTSTSPIILKPYLYHKDQPGTWGDDKAKKFPATGGIQKGVWYTVKMYVKSNTGSNTDGRIRMSINGVTLIDQAIRWTTDDSKRMIKNICFENFRGGSETYFQSTTDGTIYFDDVAWTALKY